jgi:prolyl oligopeptidase
VAIEPSDIPSLIVIPGTGQVVAIAAPGGIAPGFAAFAAELSKLDGRRTPWRRLFGKEDQVSRFDVHGDDLHLVTWKGTPRHRVIRTSLAHPDLTRAEELVPASDATLGDIVASRDAIYVEASAGGTGRILRVPYGASRRPEELKLPLDGTVVLMGGHPDVDGVLVAIAGWTRTPAIYGYDPRTGKLTDTGLRPSGRFGRPSNLVSEEVEVRSHDGTLVPLSIVHRRGLKLDGRTPTLLQGYGAYGFSTSPNFAPWDLAFYERGGVLAYAHVRGGGEHGEEWHLAGYQKTKPNTWKDFIACAEYLIAKGYTSSKHLAGIGTSAGGILIGRALTERPDLFAAAIVRVGVLDMLRFEETENGAPNVAEFGSTQTEEGFRALLEMSAYHHVRQGISYPAVLLAHGLNDARVPAWSSTKMAARLAAATASGRPVLLRLDYETGHGQGATASHRREERADIFAFVLWQCGARAAVPEAR